ncbi:MAG: arginyltransferase [Planctomycetota bacterium]
MSLPRASLTSISGDCRLVMVHRESQSCPYRAGQVATMPLSLVVGGTVESATDHWLGNGYRRTGEFVYHTECESCQACQPTRLEVARFEPTRSMRRILNRGDRELTWAWQPPRVSADRLELFNRHRQVRGLGTPFEVVDADSYQNFLVDSCCQSMELASYRNDRLVGISIVDFGRTSLSAVYTFFDPAESKYSLGTWGVLKQIEQARQTGRRYVYLGMYVDDNSHLNYKARFRPQQRLIEGTWIDVN